MKMTDATVKTLPAPLSGNKVHYDGDPAGFGVRVTAAGVRSFVFTYRIRGSQRQRQITIGRCSNWTARVARDKARALRRQVDDGGDPLGDIAAERQAPTVSELADRFITEHVLPKTRPGTTTAYLGHLRRYIRPALGNLKVAAVKFGDIDRLHRHVTDSRGPYAANRTVATLTKMFGLAVRWGYRTDNPCKGVAANRETKRRRYLKDDELPRLLKAMAAHPNRGAVNIVRMLLLTGGRVGEVLAMRWEDVDLGAGTWHKRAAATKQKTDHSVPLSAPARALLSEIAAEQAKGGAKQVFVFPGRSSASGHYADLNFFWKDLRDAAGIPDVRLHDLRHSVASVLASSGISLPIIGELLGHATPAMTSRYAHIFMDAQRAAIERVGAVVEAAGRSETSKNDGRPVPLRKGARRGR
jgi:integrase